MDNVRVHGTTGEVPAVRLAQEGLQALGSKPSYDTSRINFRRSSKDCMIGYGGHFYSVPALFSQQRLMVKETEQGYLHILTLEGEPVACHGLATGRKQRVVQASHYDGLTRPTPKRKRVGAHQLPAPEGSEIWLLEAPQVELRTLQQYAEWAEVSP